MNRVRLLLFLVLSLLSLSCFVLVLRTGAANPTSGTIMPGSTPLMWNGTAIGGSAPTGEGDCTEGVNCDTYTITVSGVPADWVGKRIRVDASWVVLASDFDVYIHKTDNSGPIVDQSAHSPPATSETAFIDPDTDGTGVFTVHVVYFTAHPGDQYHGVATVVDASASPPPPPPPLSPDWTINHHGTCCEGNLAAAGDNTFMLLPVLVNGNKIMKSSNGGQSWVQTYPPVGVSVPFGIEGDMQAFGNDVIFFGTELASAVVAHSEDAGDTWTVVQAPVASPGNDQAWSFLGPLTGMRPGGPLPLDEPYVLAGWFRIGSIAAFSFDGGLTWPVQTPLVGNNGSGPVHVVCRETAHAPNNPGDTRVSNDLFARQKAGRHGSWGTDRKFYWTEPADGTSPGARDLYVCKTDNFGVTWTGIKHPMPPGPASGWVVSHSAFDNNGTLYVLHGNKLYVSFNQGESFAFVHSLPRWGDAGRSDSGSDQFFVVDCGTIHIAMLADAGQGRGNVVYLRGLHADTATPVWQEELVDVVENVRLDFLYIVLNGHGIPTISYTVPGLEVTTASRNTPMPAFGGTPCSIAALQAFSRKTHGAQTFDVPLPFTGNSGVECRLGQGKNSDEHLMVVEFPAPVTVDSASVTSGSGSVSSATASGNQVFVNLTGVTNAQEIVVKLTNVSDGANSGDVFVPMAVLLGDTTADRRVNASDISQTKSRIGQPVDGSNFRSDVNVNAAINSSDAAVVKANSGTALP